MSTKGSPKEPPPKRIPAPALPFIDINRPLRRLAFTPVAIEVRNSRQLGERLLVDPLPPGPCPRFPGEDRHRRIAEDLWRAPLRPPGHFPVDRRLAFYDRPRPQRVAGDVV